MIAVHAVTGSPPLPLLKGPAGVKSFIGKQFDRVVQREIIAVPDIDSSATSCSTPPVKATINHPNVTAPRLHRRLVDRDVTAKEFQRPSRTCTTVAVTVGGFTTIDKYVGVDR